MKYITLVIATVILATGAQSVNAQQGPRDGAAGSQSGGRPMMMGDQQNGDPRMMRQPRPDDMRGMQDMHDMQGKQGMQQEHAMGSSTPGMASSSRMMPPRDRQREDRQDIRMMPNSQGTFGDMQDQLSTEQQKQEVQRFVKNATRMMSQLDKKTKKLTAAGIATPTDCVMTISQVKDGLAKAASATSIDDISDLQDSIQGDDIQACGMSIDKLTKVAGQIKFVTNALKRYKADGADTAAAEQLLSDITAKFTQIKQNASTDDVNAFFDQMDELHQKINDLQGNGSLTSSVFTAIESFFVW